MSYETERKVITDFLQTIVGATGLIKIAPEGESHASVANSAYVNILPGAGRQNSTGSPNNNLHTYPSVLAVTIVTEGNKGSGPAKIIADTIIQALTGLKLDENGVGPTIASTMVIDFAQLGLVPSIADARAETPNYLVVVNAPFMRTIRR